MATAQVSRIAVGGSSRREISPGMLRSAIPPQTTITLWRDQVNKAEADQLKATGYVLELIDR